MTKLLKSNIIVAQRRKEGLFMPTYIGEAISGFFTRYGSLLLLAAVMIGMVLLMVIPQRKQRKKIQAMLDGMKSGDYVRTVGGFFGTVESVEGDVVILKAGPQRKRIAISKNSISTVGQSDVENTLNDTL